MTKTRIAVPAGGDLDAIEKGSVPKVSGREALKVRGLIDAMLRSSESGRPEDCHASPLAEHGSKA